jgi:tRNA nucleotidyltransferase/poly(A) polymerase
VAFSDLRACVAEPGELLGRLSALQGTWIVGGWLRDGWLCRPTPDIDLAVAGELQPVLAQLTALYGASPFELGLRHGSHRLVCAGATIDISPVYGPDIAADLIRRDYTVNSLALPAAKLGTPISQQDLLLHPDAERDLEAGILRSISESNLSDDPLRILRGYRLSAELGFTPDQGTRQAWRELASRLPDCAAERQHEELLRLLGSPGQVAGYIQWMAEDGVLWELLPELEAMVGCEQNAYHHLDVWTHTLEALDALDELRDEVPQQLAEFADQLDSAISAQLSGMATGQALLRLSLLLHDVDKPRTREVQDDGRVTFYRHQELGQATARDLLTRLKFSSQETELVCLLVLEHLRLGFYSDKNPLPPRLVYRYVRHLGAAVPLAILHSLADCRATRGPLNEGGFAEHLMAAATILEHYFAGDAVAAPPMLLDGNEIMELLGIGPGRLVGELKDLLAEATASGEVVDQAGAREYVSEQFRRIESGEIVGGS